MPQSDIAIIGLGVMGRQLARNFASHGFIVSVYNREPEHTKKFIDEFGTKQFVPTANYVELTDSLKVSRVVMLMVTAGPAVDSVIKDLVPNLSAGDIVIDGGNSFYKDSQRRAKELAEKKIHFVGCGVSGGEEGALKGPSIMPGCSGEAWQRIKPMLEAIAAKDFNGKPCVTHVGLDGAGHYVKMVHNGIEYAVMQLIAESYGLLSEIYKLTPDKLSKIFKKFNAGKLNSYLFEIAAEILEKKDELTKNKNYVVDMILDRAGAKGTGAWTSADALARGVSVTSITEAVFARSTSAAKSERLILAKLYGKTDLKFNKPSLARFTALLENALYAGMISCYAQGYDLIQKTAIEEKWNINLAEVTRIWEGGCIIRAKLLGVLHEAYQQSKLQKASLFSVPGIVKLMKEHGPDLRTFVSVASASGESLMGFASALYYWQDMTRAHLPANMIQGLRDYFGAHTYERVDRPGIFHTIWKKI